MNINFSTNKFNYNTFTFQKSEQAKKSGLENSSLQNSQGVQNPKLERVPNSDTFEMSVGYINDLHGSTNNMMRILTGIKGDLKLSGGDNDVGDEKNQKVHKATTAFLNIADVKATAFGNHDLDTTQEDFIHTQKDLKTKVLSTNFRKFEDWEDFEDNLEEYGRASIDKELEGSTIVEVKGEKIGIVGASPIDMFERATHPNYHTDCYIDEMEDTIEDIQEEIDELKEKGINKIFLVSHLGHLRDKIVAQNTDGIDVIVGGHTHELIKDIKEGENLFYSKSGEPVIITEAGKNGNYFGQLNLSFDKEGVITKAQNNIGETRLFHKNMINQYIFDSVLGKPEHVGYIRYAQEPPKSLIEENAHANFACDAMRYETGSDIGLWNNSGTRSFFTSGAVDSRDIKDIAPFADGVSIANVSEKTLVDTFKHVVEKTYNTQGNKPGLMAVSGLNYTVNPTLGKLVGMSFVDKDGNSHSIDIDNPSEVKTYKVVTDSFVMSSGADIDVLAPKEECIELPYNKDFLMCEYIKHQNKPVDINQTGRIQFI